MTTIYKYDLLEKGDDIIEGNIRKILHVGKQKGSIMVWAEIDTSLPKTAFKIEFVATGEEIETDNFFNNNIYLGTVVYNDLMVIHVYYRRLENKNVKNNNPFNNNGISQKANFNTAKEENAVVVINPLLLKEFV